MPDDAPMNAAILVHLADLVGRAAAELARITDVVYDLDVPAMREHLGTLRAVEAALRSLARGNPDRT